MLLENETSKKPLILVSNDDGIDAPGLHTLAEVASNFGEVVVVAPASEQSAVGHAITVRDPVRAHKRNLPIGSAEVEAYAVAGTPADCIKLAVSQLLDRPPDLVVSGINRGPNTAVNVIYSGTVSAATEAAILGIESIAFSLCSWDDGMYDEAATAVEFIIAEVLKNNLPKGVLLNVNIPNVPHRELAGYQLTRQAHSRWEESFNERIDPFDRPYYWLTGEFVNLDEGANTDIDAINQKKVSITPVKYDLTAYEAMDEIEGWGWFNDRERSGNPHET